MKKLFCLLPLVASLILSTGCEEEEEKKKPDSPITSIKGVFEVTRLTEEGETTTYPDRLTTEIVLGDDLIEVEMSERLWIEITDTRLRIYFFDYDCSDPRVEDLLGYDSTGDASINSISETEINMTDSEGTFSVQYLISGSTLTLTDNSGLPLTWVLKAGNAADIAGAIDMAETASVSASASGKKGMPRLFKKSAR